jgi:hypothetical protein
VPDDLNTGEHPRKDAHEHGVPNPEAVVGPPGDPGDPSRPDNVGLLQPGWTIDSGTAAPAPEPPGSARRVSGYFLMLAGAVAVGLVGGGVIALTQEAGGCSGDDAVTVEVSVAPEIEPAVARAMGRFNEARHELGGKCVRAEVQGAEPAQVTTLLGQGSAIGTASRPDVWIPDSSLWPSLLQSMAQGDRAVEVTKTSVARSLIVVAMPQTFADDLRGRGVNAGRLTWNSLLSAGSGSAGATASGEQAIPPNLIKLQIPDPTRNAAGLGSLTLVHQLWAGDPDERTRFTGMVRNLQENTVPDVASGFATFERDDQGRYPVVIAPEQAVFTYNRSNPTNPALAVYPSDGSLSMDYPYTITTDDPEKVKAGHMLAEAIRTAETAEDVRAMGFRSTDGQAPAAFGPQAGVSQQSMPAPQPADVHNAIEVWYKLSKGIRNVTLLDVSNSTNEKLVELTRLQATAQATEEVLALVPNDTEMGIWTFGTKLQGDNDWRELVPVGPLSDRSGQDTRRQQILSVLAELEAQRGPGPGLYDSVLAAFRMISRTYNPNVVNSVLVFTNGNNEDPNGITLPDLLTALRNEFNPAQPVQIIMVGYGSGVAGEGPQRIAEATGGKAYVVQSPQQIQEVVLDAISRRACTTTDC